jgi:N-methylhydantoinase B/oxoprolinase/acetone carboxylase alpha subunit
MIQKPDGTISPLNAKDSAVLAPSETLIIRTAGGGGYGDPKKRDHSLAVEDLENQYTSEH